MKNSRLPLYLIVILITLVSCEKDDSPDMFEVSGYLFVNGKPLVAANVNIDNLEQYKTTSNEEGFFKIENVSKGSHKLYTQNEYGDGTFIAKSFDVEVNSNLNFNELILPTPVSINSLALDSLTNTATLMWNKSYAADFREYKLYSHTSSGLDETTGMLEHVATSPEDTTFSLTLSNSSETYFRVFVMNDYGQLGGSNIISVNSLNLDLLIGTNFENQQLFSNHWTIESGNVLIVDTTSYQGNNSLLMQNTISWDPWHIEESLISSDISLEKDTEYILSFWYKVQGNARMDYHTLYFYYYQDNENRIETNVSFETTWPGGYQIGGPVFYVQTDWLYFSKVFMSTSDYPARFYIGGQVENILLDEIKIKVNE